MGVWFVEQQAQANSSSTPFLSSYLVSGKIALPHWLFLAAYLPLLLRNTYHSQPPFHSFNSSMVLLAIALPSLISIPADHCLTAPPTNQLYQTHDLQGEYAVDATLLAAGMRTSKMSKIEKLEVLVDSRKDSKNFDYNEG
jgi:hypothetical protein